MSHTKDLIIPVKDKIRDFKIHLDSHPRTILSAKYGDGKSFFINEMRKSYIITKKYKILTIYPVNYQVADNRDIFDLIKRDILIQLIINEMIDPNLKISDEVALSFYIQNKGLNIVEDLLSFANSINADSKKLALLCHAIKGANWIIDLLNKGKELKKKYKSEEAIDDFLNQFEDSNSIYENDLITKIIRDSLSDYKKGKKKKVVLIFEDMDRIDPAHLFRIMNILSAHMDFSYHLGKRPTYDNLESNKFGFDNIVLSLDYKNLRSIFEHFYGEKTDFHGYISKFSDRGYFKYSLAENKEHYIIDLIQKETELDADYIEQIINPSQYSNKTLREIKRSINNTALQIYSVPQIGQDGKRISLNQGLLKLLVILRRFGMEDTEIAEMLFSTCHNNFNQWLSLLAPYMYFKENCQKSIFRIASDKYDLVMYFEGVMDNGTADIRTERQYRDEMNRYNFKEFCLWLLSLIGY